MPSHVPIYFPKKQIRLNPRKSVAKNINVLLNFSICCVKHKSL